MSASLPTIDYVIACESVRPELANKLNILGFYGVLPRAHIRILEWGKPTGLLFLVNTHGGTKKFTIRLTIKQPDSSELLPGIAVETEPALAEANAMIAFQFPAIIFKTEGEHKIEVHLNDQSVYEKPFLVGKGLLDIPSVL